MKDPENSTNLPPIAPDIAALLAVEKKISAVPDDAKARAVARAQASLLARDWAIAPRSPRIVRPRLLAAAGVSLLIAVAGAAAFQMQRRAAPEPSVRSAPARAGVEPPITPSVEPVVLTQKILPPKPISRPSRTARTPTVAREPGDELPLLREAREAVGRRAFADALARLAEHEARFPNGRFAEEREALKVRSLSGLGRKGEARRAAEAFRTHFPHSVLLPAMNEAVQ
jgi:hypothetical protein